jgi:hypothetical protein
LVFTQYLMVRLTLSAAFLSVAVAVFNWGLVVSD